MNTLERTDNGYCLTLQSKETYTFRAGENLRNPFGFIRYQTNDVSNMYFAQAGFNEEMKWRELRHSGGLRLYRSVRDYVRVNGNSEITLGCTMGINGF